MSGFPNASGPFGPLTQRLSTAILHYLSTPSGNYQPFSAPQPKLLARCLQPGDVLLVEGNTRLSAIIKYLTQSTWSHATLYVGPEITRPEDIDLDANVLLEAEAEEGVRLSSISKYVKFNTRICRPFGLSKADREKVVDFALRNVGKQYDSHHIVDLLRYLFPYPPVPVALRRRMLAIGAGDPTRAICSTLIAASFYSVNYPILPAPITQDSDAECDVEVAPFVSREVFHIKKTGLFTPRDFDVSPYFEIVKPLVKTNFDYHRLVWEED
ncbi:MAG TPA: YiiX/YebB-like N1pC/P60 family cysteine hydrolase [Dongiaceae bacterium]